MVSKNLNIDRFMNGKNICLGRDLHFMSFISVIDLNCSELINIFCGTNKSNTNGNGALSWSPSEVAIFVYLRICVNYLYLCISNFVIYSNAVQIAKCRRK